mmetsp:Transcript_22177/g.50970  ORF Transcript_22177/g.50970 Transcript_22177/m.50970 type:complete len:245 (-) Transcript_22177:491-1225(-)
MRAWLVRAWVLYRADAWASLRVRARRHAQQFTCFSSRLRVASASVVVVVVSIVAVVAVVGGGGRGRSLALCIRKIRWRLRRLHGRGCLLLILMLGDIANLLGAKEARPTLRESVRTGRLVLLPHAASASPRRRRCGRSHSRRGGLRRIIFRRACLLRDGLVRTVREECALSLLHPLERRCSDSGERIALVVGYVLRLRLLASEGKTSAAAALPIPDTAARCRTTPVQPVVLDLLVLLAEALRHF